MCSTFLLQRARPLQQLSFQSTMSSNKCKWDTKYTVTQISRLLVLISTTCFIITFVIVKTKLEWSLMVKLQWCVVHVDGTKKFSINNNLVNIFCKSYKLFKVMDVIIYVIYIYRRFVSSFLIPVLLNLLYSNECNKLHLNFII